MVGALQYVTMNLPNISFVVSRVKQFIHSPQQPHLQEVKRIFTYLAGTIQHGLLLHKQSCMELHVYVDAN